MGTFASIMPELNQVTGILSVAENIVDEMKAVNKRAQALYPATSCMGDSGGPLTYVQNGQEVLLGNVSWGHSKCSTNGYPAAYSRNADPTANAWIRTNAG